MKKLGILTAAIAFFAFVGVVNAETVTKELCYKKPVFTKTYEVITKQVGHRTITYRKPVFTKTYVEKCKTITYTKPERPQPPTPPTH